MTGPEENRTVNFVSPESQCLPETKSKRNIEIQGKQKSLFPKGPIIKRFVIWQNKWVKLVIKTKANLEKRAQIPVSTSGHLQLHALITCNSGQHFVDVTVNCFLFDIIVFAVLPAHGI